MIKNYKNFGIWKLHWNYPDLRTYIVLNFAVRTDPFGNAMPNKSVLNEALGESGGSTSFSSPKTRTYKRNLVRGAM